VTTISYKDLLGSFHREHRKFTLNPTLIHKVLLSVGFSLLTVVTVPGKSKLLLEYDRKQHRWSRNSYYSARGVILGDELAAGFVLNSGNHKSKVFGEFLVDQCQK